jgi:tRNA-2-methylthio-N6-dimethylallyladenosine synthase
VNEWYYITTFGCQMNAHDAEVLAGLLDAMGYNAASSPEEADLILINTCCVRESAENRTFGHLGNLKALKEGRPGRIIGVCGCMTQESGNVERIQASFPHVDLVFGTHNLHQLPELLQRLQGGERPVIEIWEGDGSIHEGLPVRRGSSFKAWVTIMYGCNNFCSYCIVPQVRGRERSREFGVILSEIRGLQAAGFREVTLLGQNVNSYGLDRPEREWDFARLLEEIAAIGIPRIRFQTSHPKDLSDKLIAVMAANPNICRHLHLPVQAGSSRILQLMNRHYSKESYLELVGRIRAVIPDIALTTDIIVGFPGETGADFDDTLDLVEKIRYDGAFTFIYSPRANTTALEMGDTVPAPEKRERLQRLIELQNRISRECNEAWVGRHIKLLVDGPSERDPAIWSGRMSQNKLVHFKPLPQIKPGGFVEADIIRAQTFTLEGRLCGIETHEN